MNEVMLDLETLATTPHAAVIAIGAVRLNSPDEFYVVITQNSNEAAGLEVDPSTVLWWSKQSPEARAEFEGGKGITLPEALARFAVWLGRDAIVWGNGAAFDNVILASAYRACGFPVPWNFWHDKCYRTVAGMAPSIERQRVGTYHNALDDAKTQAAHLLAIRRAYGW